MLPLSYSMQGEGSSRLISCSENRTSSRTQLCRDLRGTLKLDKVSSYRACTFLLHPCMKAHVISYSDGGIGFRSQPPRSGC